MITKYRFALFSFAVCVTTLPALVSAQTPELPRPDHIIVVIEENHAYDQIIGSSAAPHLNALANGTNAALFTQSFAIEHPSQPNYLDFYAGCNQEITDDNLPSTFPFTTDNLGHELIDSGLTFATYSEDLPSVGFNGATSANYARKHNPAANWMGTSAHGIPSTTNQPLTAFPTDFTKLPTVAYVIPNLNDDMHNGSDPSTITAGDTWFYNHLNTYVTWAQTHNSMVIVTWDEDDNSNVNQIPTIFAGPMIKGGQYSEKITHYSVLRTIEDIYGLGHACNAATATPITDVWQAASVSASGNIATTSLFSVYPNPASAEVTIGLNRSGMGNTPHVEIFDLLGHTVFSKTDTGSAARKVDLSKYPRGSYFVRVSIGNLVQTKRVTLR